MYDFASIFGVHTIHLNYFVDHLICARLLYFLLDYINRSDWYVFIEFW